MNGPNSGLSRRHFVRHVAAASMLGPMSQFLQTAQAARAKGKAAKNRSMILLWMSGGPSTIDIWDLKPDVKNGCEVKPIS